MLIATRLDPPSNCDAIGPRQVYTAIVRTAAYETEGLEYHADFATTRSYSTARLPFSSFRAYKDGQRVRGDKVELDRRQVVGECGEIQTRCLLSHT